MTEPLYIWINRWEEFQVYQKKRGKDWTPPWIRVYTRLLDDYHYLGLTGRQRGLLHDLWLLFAKSRLELGSSPSRIGRMIGDPTVRMRDLEALNRAGFIDFCSRTVLEQRRNAFWNRSTLEVDVEGEEEPFLPSVSSTPEPSPEPEAKEQEGRKDADDNIDYDPPDETEANGAGSGGRNEIEDLKLDPHAILRAAGGGNP